MHCNNANNKGRPLCPAPPVHEAVDTSHQADPIELAGLFQGDILLDPRDQLKELNEVSPGHLGGGGKITRNDWRMKARGGVRITIIRVFIIGEYIH